MVEQAIMKQIVINDKVVFLQLLPDGVFIKVRRGRKDNIHEALINVFFDCNKKIIPVSGVTWEKYIEYGRSYEIDTIADVIEFKNRHLTYIT